MAVFVFVFATYDERGLEERWDETVDQFARMNWSTKYLEKMYDFLYDCNDAGCKIYNCRCLIRELRHSFSSDVFLILQKVQKVQLMWGWS